MHVFLYKMLQMCLTYMHEIDVLGGELTVLPALPREGRGGVAIFYDKEKLHTL